MFKIRILVFILVNSFFVISQNYSDFTTLKCGPNIPKDFTILASDFYRSDLEENNDKNLDQDFFLSTRFLMNDLLLSGYVLFDEPVSNYLNKVAQYTLEDEGDLNEKLRFYVLKDLSPNAFSTDQGIIIFTTGLLAQLENEAQLAYIICHEVSHYKEKHVRNNYIENKNIIKGKGKYKKVNYSDKIKQMNKYSKELEFEADQKGIDIYINSEYSIEEIFSSFEVLLYSYLPFDDIKFDKEFFNTEFLKIPTVFFPDTINEISKELVYKDEDHSHPNLQKRIDAAFDYLENKNSNGKKKYVISEKDFINIRNLSRFENLNLLIAERNYGKALYNIFLLKREFKDNKFLDKSLLKSFYGLMKYSNYNKSKAVLSNLKKVEGESYVLHGFIKNLTKQQLNIITFRYAHDFRIKYKEDKIFEEYYQDIKLEFAMNSKIDPKTLKDISFEQYENSKNNDTLNFNIQDSIKKVEESDLSKYEKIRIKKELKEIENLANMKYTNIDFHLFALSDIVSEDKNFINDLQKLKNSDQNYNEVVFNSKEKYYLGIDKLVVVDPIYQESKLNKKVNLVKSEENKVGLYDMYQKKYNKLTLETQIIDSKKLENDVQNYNDIGILNSWVEEVFLHEENNIPNMINSRRDLMTDLNNKYKTSHYLFSGFFAYRYFSSFNTYHFVAFYFLVGSPWALWDLLVPKYYFDFIALSIDSSKDEIVFSKHYQVDLKTNNYIINSYIYDVLYQLNKKPKNK